MAFIYVTSTNLVDINFISKFLNMVFRTFDDKYSIRIYSPVDKGNS